MKHLDFYVLPAEYSIETIISMTLGPKCCKAMRQGQYCMCNHKFLQWSAQSKLLDVTQLEKKNAIWRHIMKDGLPSQPAVIYSESRHTAHSSWSHSGIFVSLFPHILSNCPERVSITEGILQLWEWWELVLRSAWSWERFLLPRHRACNNPPATTKFPDWADHSIRLSQCQATQGIKSKILFFSLLFSVSVLPGLPLG